MKDETAISKSVASLTGAPIAYITVSLTVVSSSLLAGFGRLLAAGGVRVHYTIEMTAEQSAGAIDAAFACARCRGDGRAVCRGNRRRVRVYMADKQSGSPGRGGGLSRNGLGAGIGLRHRGGQ